MRTRGAGHAAAGPGRAPVVAVETRELTRVFGSGKDAVTALDSVSIRIHGNEFFTLLGPSGCGKTTLLRMIAGFEHPSAGLVLLDGEDIGHLPPYLRQVNTVFQNYALFPHMTVAENIAFGLEMLGKGREEISRSVEGMLALVRMEKFGGRKTTRLSGGQQQRVALARALAPRPKVLLLDEPLSALDLKLRKEMQIELKRMQHETGITFVFVTHDQEEALTMSDRVAVMSEGRIRQVGSPREVYDHPVERFVAHFIGETNFLEGRLRDVSGGRGTVVLPGGVQVPASVPEGVGAGEVSVVVRPEHAFLSEDRDASPLRGVVKNVVYFGTDTNYHLELATGGEFVVRMQNRRDAGTHFAEGRQAGVAFQENAVQALKD